MLSFTEFFTETYQKGQWKRANAGGYSYNDHVNLKKHLVPAVVHRKSATLYVGKRGDTHEDLVTKHKNDKHKNFESGYYDRRDKKFHERRKLGMDSTDLMNHRQLERFYAGPHK